MIAGISAEAVRVRAVSNNMLTAVTCVVSYKLFSKEVVCMSFVNT